MRFELVHRSPFTRYAVGMYTNPQECERDCSKRYGVTVHFERDQFGILRAEIPSDMGTVELSLYEEDIPHAP